MPLINANTQEIPTPAAPQRRYGVFTAATQLPMEAGMARSGVTWAAEDCGMSVVTYDPTCAPPHPAKVFEPGTPFVESTPYWLVQTYQCGSVGTTAADVTRRVRRRYEAGVQNMVERVIWDGAGFAGVTPVLTAAPPANEVLPTGAGAGAAIAALEHAFYDAHGYVGTIHMNTTGYAAVEYAGLMDRAGGAGVFTTPMGSRWSIGAGYGVTGPANVAPPAGFVYAFMTPQTYLWASDVRTPEPTETFERTTNQWLGLAETVWMHGWLCDTVYAVKVPIAAPATAAAPAIPALG